MDAVMANAMIVWPEGKEKRSGGSSVAQQLGSVAHGRSRPARFFTQKNTAQPMPAEASPVRIASIREDPPKSATNAPTPIQSHPSPAREAATIHVRSQRGGRQRLTRLIKRRSPAAIIRIMANLPPACCAGPAPAGHLPF